MSIPVLALLAIAGVQDRGQGMITHSVSPPPVMVGPSSPPPGMVAVPAIEAPADLPADPPAIRERSRPQLPLVAYVHREDYPASALGRGEQGTTFFRLTVGPDGRVVACAVEGTSGSAALDDATCRIMLSRARVSPARDTDGNPAADTIRSGIAWRLEGPPAEVPFRAPPPPVMVVVQPSPPPVVRTPIKPPPSAPAPPPPAVGPRIVEGPRPRAPFQSYVTMADYPASALVQGEEGRPRFRLMVGADGRVSHCVILASSGSSALDNATCRIMRSRARFTPARDSNGNPAAGEYPGEINWQIAR